MGGRQGERGVVPAEVRQVEPAGADGVDELGRVAVGRRPGEDRGEQLVERQGGRPTRCARRGSMARRRDRVWPWARSAEARQSDEQRLVPPGASIAARTPSSRGSSRGSASRSARKGIPSSRAIAAAGRSSRLVRARIACVVRSVTPVAALWLGPGSPPGSVTVGQVARTCRARSSSSAASGARTSCPTAFGRATIRLANRSALPSTSRTARSTTGAGQRKFVTRSWRRRPGSRPARSSTRRTSASRQP